MHMKLTFRWYGEKDSIPLDYIQQIPNIYSVVTSVYDVKPGEVWSLDSLKKLKADCDKHHLKMEVIESIPVSEDIKLGTEKRDQHIEAFKKNLELCAQVGVKCVCYNFMPVFDWLRTDMKHLNPDGSNSLSYSYKDFAKVDPHNLHLPGWDESYSQDELQKLLETYKGVTHMHLFENLVYFLKAIMPTCEKVGINMAIHPDDPPWDVFDLPRIVSSEDDIDRMFASVPSKNNGLTLCTGSLGAGRDNDIAEMAGKYAKEGRLYFLHMRNILYTDNQGSFVEAGHCSCEGSLDMAKIVKALVDNGFDGYVRPDHGRNIFGENGKPGYGLYDRALGCAYINGLFEGIEKYSKKQ
jgi:mannonate dehydratase